MSDYFLWDGDQLFADLDSLGNKGVEYSYYPGLDSLHAIIVGSTPYFAHSDALGNVVALSDQSQNLARSYSYGIWGQSSGGNDNVGFGNKDRARWKGALWMGPEVDLYYLRNRWYGPTAGRFWSEDPIGLAGGINPYTFAGNDPVNGKDPTGLFCGGWWLTVQINFATIMTSIGGTGVAAYNIPVSCVDWEPLIGSLDADALFSQSASAFDQISGAAAATSTGRAAPNSRSFGKCLTSHYDVESWKNLLRGLSWAGSFPLPKRRLGLPRLPGTSPLTNPVSVGRFLVRDVHLPSRTLGSSSLFGAAGRANYVLSAGIAAYDVTSIALCTFTDWADYAP